MGADTDCENWRPVVAYEGFYEVSDKGRIRSLPRKYQQIQNGIACARYISGRILKLKVKPNGYAMFCASVGNAKKYLHIHRVVLMAFVGAPPFEDWHADHIDGDRQNNELGNLRWLSPHDNRALRLHCIGDKRKDTKVPDIAVLALRNHEMTPQKASELFDVTVQHATRIQNNDKGVRKHV